MRRLMLAATLLLLNTIPGSAQDFTQSTQSLPERTKPRLLGRFHLFFVSPPTAGVKLLEDIFIRVRSAPQVAMAKNLKQQQQLAQAPTQQGPTDYRLAIHPKDNAKGALPQSPVLGLLPSNESAAKPLAIAFGGGGGAGGAGNNRSSRQQGAALMDEPPAPSVETWMGNRNYPALANNPQSGAEGFWESSKVQSDDKERKVEYGRFGNKAEESQTRGTTVPVDLLTAANRLHGVAKTIEQLQSQNQNMPARGLATNGTQLARAGAKLAPQLRADMVYSQSQASGAPASSALGPAAAPAPAVNVFVPGNAGPLAKQKAMAIGRDKYDADDGVAGSISDAQEQKKAGSTKRRAKEKVAAKERREADKAEFLDEKIALNSDLALLPPNLVTGIPLVRLGLSQKQVSSALQKMGPMKEDKVEHWTILSWQNPKDKNQTSLQLYMRNGLLDAMRIFDASLIAPDFGVRMGDELSRVKERFGEPAFILQEPGPGAGQNYIYPISQVGFQLARATPNAQPHVMSVLIFNVK